MRTEVVLAHFAIATENEKGHRNIMAMDGATQAKPAEDASAQDTLEQTIYLISHDLMAPARAIATIPDWIDEDLKNSDVVLPTEVQDSLDLLKSQGQRLQGMITDLLTYSRVGRNQTAFSGNWDAVLHEVASRLPKLERFDCDIQLSGTPDVGCFDVQHLVFALLSNAQKHHSREDGVIRLSTSIHGANWRITVSDDGPGIPEKDRAKVRQLFTTLKSRDIVEGSGMGLPIVEKICSHTGGQLRISDGDDGIGCKVTVDLPCVSMQPL